MNNKIQRVRPQSKRKALNAKAFAERYRSELAMADLRDYDSDHILQLERKADFWQARYDWWAMRQGADV